MALRQLRGPDRLHLIVETRDGEELRLQALRYVVRMDGRYKVVRCCGEE